MLHKGQVIIFPTDTVYGMGCLAGDFSAYQRIHLLKGRPDSKHFILLCGSIADIEKYALVNDRARRVIDKYMPGALTLILPAISGETVGVRIPNHSTAKALIAENGVLATTSVNISDQEPLNDYRTIKEIFGSKVDYIIRDEKCSSSYVSSTIVSLVGEPKVLRVGTVNPNEVINEYNNN